MLKLDSKKILLTTLGIFIFLIFFRFFSLISFPDSQTVLEKGEELKLYPNQSFTQTVVAKRDNLNKIEFLLRTPGPKRDSPLSVTLSDETCTTPLRKSVLEPSFLSSDNLYMASFSPLKNSNGKKYCVTLSYPTTNIKAKSLRFFTMENRDETMSLTASDQEIKNQSLSIRLVYNNDYFWQDLSELDQRISQYKPWFLKHFSIASTGLFSVLLSVALITALITLKIEDKNN